MTTLEKRIAALEAASGAGIKPITNLVRFAVPGHLDVEIEALHTRYGQIWRRLDGETEQELIDRASSEAQRTEWGVAVLFEGADDAQA